MFALLRQFNAVTTSLADAEKPVLNPADFLSKSDIAANEMHVVVRALPKNVLQDAVWMACVLILASLMV
jgi:hypothetical protein